MCFYRLFTDAPAVAATSNAQTSSVTEHTHTHTHRSRTTRCRRRSERSERHASYHAASCETTRKFWPAHRLSKGRTGSPPQAARLCRYSATARSPLKNKKHLGLIISTKISITRTAQEPRDKFLTPEVKRATSAEMTREEQATHGRQRGQMRQK